MESNAPVVNGGDSKPQKIVLQRKVSSSLGVSLSPTNTMHGTSWSSRGDPLTRVNSAPSFKHLKPFNTEDIKVLLLENVNQTGRDLLEGQGYQVSFLKSSLPEDELIERIRWGNASDVQTARATTADAPF